MSEPYYGAPPQKKGLGPWAWLGIGCGVALCAFVGFIAFVIFVVFAAIRTSTPYQNATARAIHDPRVIAALGQPIEADFFVTGSVNTENDTGTVDLNIGLTGARRKAHLLVLGTRKDHVWTYTTMRVEPDGMEPIDLLKPGSSP